MEDIKSLYYKKFLALIAKSYGKQIKDATPGHCMKIEGLPKSELQKLIGMLRPLNKDLLIYILSDTETGNDFTHAAKLIELRNNPDKALLVLIPANTSTSAEDSYGDATFQNLSVSDLTGDFFHQLKEEIQRIADSTQFNGQNLLDGNFDYKAYTDNNDIKVSSYGPAVQSGDYTITGLNWSVINAETGSLEAQLTVTGPKPSTNPVQDLNVSMMDNYITATGAGGFKMVFAVDEKLVFDNDGKAQAGSAADFNVSCTGIGPMRLQVGSNEGQVIPVEVPAISLGNLGITKLDVTSQEKAHDAIDRLKGATAFLSSVRGKLGAYQNRLESTTENLGVVEENMTAAYSRIMDVDMAEEMTNYSTYNVIVQAGTSVLAQANEDWAMIAYNGAEGYMMLQFLTPRLPQADERYEQIILLRQQLDSIGQAVQAAQKALEELVKLISA